MTSNKFCFKICGIWLFNVDCLNLKPILQPMTSLYKCVNYHANMTSHDSQQYLWNLNLIKNIDDNVFFLTRKVLNPDNSPVFLISRKALVIFKREATKSKNSSNSHLIRQRFYGNCCKSGIVIFAWRVTWNYTYSSFNQNN